MKGRAKKKHVSSMLFVLFIIDKLKLTCGSKGKKTL